MFTWIRKYWDYIFLSDSEWKKKYCPYLYHFIFEMTSSERSKLLGGDNDTN